MFTLKLEEREKNSKGRQLRNQGIVPAVLYGKHLKESISMQLPCMKPRNFFIRIFIGSKVELEIENAKHLAILKEVTHTPGAYKIEHLSFQALVAGEEIKSVAKVILTGREKVREGVVMHILDDIAYSALPADLVDRIEVDVSTMKPGDVITVGDLEILKNKKIELITASDNVVVTVTIPKKFTEDEVVSEDQVTEPELVTEAKTE